MKLLIYNIDKRIHVVSDSSIARSGQPWFLPDFGESWRWRQALAVKISRLGKGIHPKHLMRYVDEMTLLWVAESDSCEALDFIDGRVVCGSWIPINDELPEMLADAIIDASKYATLKNGDIIAVMTDAAPQIIEPNTAIELKLHNQTVIRFNIK